ncbi:M20 family peptidase [Sediminicola luteus]|uniref:Peptidase M20 dimerisation domain-containing protein n=1 Tax=Sediminicola luteus TaxID=319238 RepID=A0A2A4G6G7_9FLAO|nr:M20 family peptidase [Sediminicola luteus]PCE64023.1 hypothetical protein B7P33_12305 [Sediminicola luteus]
MKKILWGLLALILIVVAILAFKTLSFTSKQLAVEKVAQVQPNAGYESRLAEAVRHKTISMGSGITDSVAYRGFVRFMAESFPLADSLLEKTAIGEFSLVYKWPGKNKDLKPVLLMAHSDVVPVEEATLPAWEMDPFGGEIKDGYIWGRGTMDDKGNGLAIMEALTLHLQNGFSPERTLYFSFGHDEEVGGAYGARKVAEYFKNQDIEFEYVLDEGGVLLDPGFFPGLDKPVALIGIAEKGYASIKFTAKLDEAGHSSMPPNETAIGLLSETLETLKENPFPAELTAASAAMFDFLGPEMSFPNKTIFANRWLLNSVIIGILEAAPTSNAMVRTTIAPTIISGGVKDNVLPTQASLTANFRILPGSTEQDVLERLRKIIPDERIHIDLASRGFEGNPSPISPIDSPGFENIQKTIGQVYPDRIVAPMMLIAGTDTKHFAELSKNVYRINPIAMKKADIPRIHGINERVGVEEYKTAIAFFHQLIGNSNGL